MKKYVLRSVGWIFDDDWYNFDDVHDLVGIYNTKEEAVEKKVALDFLFFLYQFPYLSRYQLKFLNHAPKENPEFVDVKKARILLAEKLNLKEEELFDFNSRPPDFRKDKKQLLKNIPQVELHQIMKSIKLEFFKIYEFDEDEIFFYHFKKNPFFSAWNIYEEEEPNYYFYDGRDRDPLVKRAVTTIKEAYEFALQKSDGFGQTIGPILTRKVLIKGDFSDLSHIPQILESIIQNSETISFDVDSKSIKFKAPIAVEELMALDSVLKEPLLILEKVGIKTLNKRTFSGIKDSIERELGL